MSGYQSSKRQWIPGRVRALLVVVLALAMLIPVVSAYAAGSSAHDVQQEAPGPVPLDVLCVKGSVINFDETPLGAGWRVTATPIDPPGPVVETTTDDHGWFKFENLSVGKWDFALTLQESWEPVTPANFSVTIDYGDDKHCAEIRFKVKRPVKVTVIKIDDQHNLLEGWKIRAEPGKGNWFASPVEAETDVNGEALFSLTEGKWIFKEKAPRDTMYVPVMPETGVQVLNVEWHDGDGITIRFKNRIFYDGCIEAYKLDVPPNTDQPSFGLPGWKILVKRTDGSVVLTGFTDSQGYVKFNRLPLGPYIVTEEEKLGWDPVTPTAFKVNLTGPDCESVTFFNQQNPPGYVIEGRKIDTNGKVGIPGWKITASPVNKGGYPDKKIDGFDRIEVLTDGQGKYSIELPANDYRIPGSTYKVCEEDHDGWLPHTAKCQKVFLPWKPSAPVHARDFENQQVGHWESVTYGKHDDGKHDGKGDNGNDGKHDGNGGYGNDGYGCPNSHIVAPGESLYGIGAAYGAPPRRNAGRKPMGLWPSELLRVSRRLRLRPVSSRS